MGESSMEQLSAGTRVVDTEDEKPDVAVGVLRPDKTIADWVYPTQDGKLTVAETNPEYPADSPVVVVVFQSELEKEWPAWNTAEPAVLFDGVHYYGFPDARLVPVRDETPAGDNLNSDDDAIVTDADGSGQRTIDPPEALLELGERLEANGATVIPDRGGIVVEKMGEEYRITPSGRVEGEGGELAENMASLAAKYVSDTVGNSETD